MDDWKYWVIVWITSTCFYLGEIFFVYLFGIKGAIYYTAIGLISFGICRKYLLNKYWKPNVNRMVSYRVEK